MLETVFRPTPFIRAECGMIEHFVSSSGYVNTLFWNANIEEPKDGSAPSSFNSVIERHIRFIGCREIRHLLDELLCNFVLCG
jgi:hypothetical protein